MAKTSSTFEERLARIAQERDSSEPLPPAQSFPAHGDELKRGFQFQRAFLMPMIMVLVLALAQLSDDVFAAILPSDGTNGGDLSVKEAVAIAKNRLANDGNLSQMEKRGLRTFIRNNEGKSFEGTSRESMLRELTRKAREIGHEAMAKDFERLLNACRSAKCLETVYSIALMDIDVHSY